MRLSLFLISWCAALMLIVPQALPAAEMAVIPYRVQNPSIHFPVSSGEEYARLLAVAAFIKKGVAVTSPRDVALDLKRLSIDPQKTVTEEQLGLYGRTKAIDYILAGTVSRTRGRLVSRSVLYSVKDGTIAARIRVHGSDFIHLCSNEISEALVRFDDRRGVRAGPSLDALFLVDLSYAIKSEWSGVRKGIISFTGNVIDRAGIDSRIYTVPFSSKTGTPSCSLSENSILSVKRELEHLRPAGSTDTAIFSRAFRYAVRNTRWRRKAARMIIIIGNTPLAAGADSDTLAVEARAKGIHIHSLCLGNIRDDGCEALDRAASITGGGTYYAAYHQRLNRAAGEPVEIYMERGRLFHSPEYNGEWKNGLIITRHRGSGFGGPRPFLEEVYYNEKKHRITPGTMADKYALLKDERIISEKERRSNIEDILGRLAEKLPGHEGPAGAPGDRILLSDGTVSVWVTVRDSAMIRFFKSKKGKAFFPLGVSFRKEKGGAYGIEVVPRITGLTSDYIPDLLRARLKDAVRKPDYYSSRGLFYPPVWFIRCRVEGIRAHGYTRDIRD